MPNRALRTLEIEGAMGKQRLEAFTDGVVAVIITIMVLEMKVPAGMDFTSLKSGLPMFLVYALSFASVVIYWNNHHYMFHLSDRTNGRVLWTNMFVLFWLSLVPLSIRWMEESHFAALPTAVYGGVLALAAIAMQLLERALIACNGRDSKLAGAVGREGKGKASWRWHTRRILSILGFILGIALAFSRPWIAITMYALVAVLWLIPERRIESRIF
jgi:uncharacterized membrane protein